MSTLAANPQLLLNLQGLVNAGHINPEEFAAEKAKLFNAPFDLVGLQDLRKIFRRSSEDKLIF